MTYEFVMEILDSEPSYRLKILEMIFPWQEFEFVTIDDYNKQDLCPFPHHRTLYGTMMLGIRSLQIPIMKWVVEQLCLKWNNATKDNELSEPSQDSENKSSYESQDGLQMKENQSRNEDVGESQKGNFRM